MEREHGLARTLTIERWVDYARLLAVIQGVVWFALLSFGGQGLIYGPLAWFAVIIGKRFPGIAAGLLLIPVAWLCQGWAPILLDRPDTRKWLIFGTLVIPAVTAAAVLALSWIRRRFESIAPV